MTGSCARGTHAFHKIREKSWVAEEILEPDKACAPVTYVWMPATRRGRSMVVSCSCMCELTVKMSEDLPLFHHTSSWFGVQFTTGTTSPFVNEYQNLWECEVKGNAFGNSKLCLVSWSVLAFKLPLCSASRSWHRLWGTGESSSYHRYVHFLSALGVALW